MRTRSYVAVGLGSLVLVVAVGLLSWRGGHEPAPVPVRAASNRQRALPPLAAPPRGLLHVRGLVRNARGEPAAGVDVSATMAIAGETLSSQPCSEDAPELTLTQSDCQGAAALWLREQVEQQRGQAPVLARATTAADGTFTLDALPEGKVTVWALSEAGSALAREVASGSEQVSLVLQTSYRVSGRVVDESGTPLPGAQVTVFHRAHSRYFEGHTGADGRFRVGPLPPGDYSFVVTHPGFLGSDIFEASVTGEEDEDVVLFRARRIVGRVVDGDRLIAGVEVHEEEGERVAVTDSEGRFFFESMPPGEYRLMADTANGQGFSRVALTEDLSEARVTLRLGTLAYVEGSVRGEDGRPVAGAHVVVREFVHTGHVVLPREREADADAAGHFRVGPLSARDYDFAVSSPAHVDLSEERTVVFGEAMDFTLQPAVLVEGVVMDEKGSPVPEISLGLSARAVIEELVARDEDGNLLPSSFHAPLRHSRTIAVGSPATSDAQGRFQLKAPVAAAYELRAGADEYLSLTQSVDAPSRDVRVVVHRGGTVKGFVGDQLGVPIADVEVSLTSTEGEELGPTVTEATDSEGHFTLLGVRPGSYAVFYTVGEGGMRREASVPVRIQGAETVEVSLRVPLTGSLSGVVVDTAGRPLSGVVVEAEARDEDTRLGELGFSSLQARTGPDGRFSFERMAEGRYALRASLDGYAMETPRPARRALVPREESDDALDSDALDEITAAEESEVLAKTGTRSTRLVMRFQGRITGRLVDEAGKPITAFLVSSEPHRDPTGAFTYSVYRNEKQLLVFDVPGYTYATRKVDVPMGESVDLGTVRLERGRRIRGRVLDAQTGRSLVGTQVQLLYNHAPDDPEVLREVLSQEEGLFELPVLDPHLLSLKVFAAEHATYLHPLTGGDEFLEVRLDTGSPDEGG
ncbi:carboxypeptidase-like regulatory domain-containing protein [Corallococcus sp. M34]|uniref:carboxypeptidase-like regulatory domain-containing protein n=1 Tax=Citreicoccus inhibens TaxID=2849499 RepID=UPI001C233CDA|nr:carboxypeptidase-like regulatory domain-containing protein [Citreicoccus inhibens]MBU8898806.1 carboxypeptidase-like regulatory domain-containing protein [Citreicoccus inhibens]